MSLPAKTGKGQALFQLMASEVSSPPLPALPLLPPNFHEGGSSFQAQVPEPRQISRFWVELYVFWLSGIEWPASALSGLVFNTHAGHLFSFVFP